MALTNIRFTSSQLPVSVGFPAGPQAIALVDVNGDGEADILAVDLDNDLLNLFLNNGSGGFKSTPDLTLGTGVTPVAVATGDFDRDGKLDVAVVNQDDDSVTIAFGDGQGNFIFNIQTLPTDPSPVGLVAVDLNGDRAADLAVLSDDTVHLIKSNSDRTFTTFSPASVGTRSSGAVAIAAGLINNSDTFIDLAISNAGGSNNISVLLGKGDGTFQVATLQNVGLGPNGIVIADLNKDGKADLAVVDSDEIADQNISLLYGKGDGTFQDDIRTDGEVDSVALAAADFDLDGFIDLAATNISGGMGVSTLRNDPSHPSDPNNRNGFSLLDYPGLGDAVAIQTGEINGDGRPDLIALNADGDTIGIFLNTTGPPTATPTPTRTGTPTPAPSSTPTVPMPRIDIGSAVGRPGEAVDLTVSLFAAGLSIAATANDIQFDPHTLTFNPSMCRVNPMIGKSLVASIVPNGFLTPVTLRVFVEPNQNFDSIPSGPLYTCTIQIAPSAFPGSYPLFNGAALVIGADDNSVAAFGTYGIVQVSLVATPHPTSTPRRTASGSSGCAVSAESDRQEHDTPFLMLLILIVCVARRGRTHWTRRRL